MLIVASTVFRIAQKEKEKEKDKDAIPTVMTTAPSPLDHTSRPRLPTSILAGRTSSTESSRQGASHLSDSRDSEGFAASSLPLRTEITTSSQEDADRDKPKPSKAYNKSVPSLDAITERLARARVRSGSNADRAVTPVEDIPKKELPLEIEVVKIEVNEGGQDDADKKEAVEEGQSDATVEGNLPEPPSEQKEHPLQHSW